MKTLSMSIISILILSTISFAQPDILWEQTFGGGWDDYGYCVQQTSDDGYIIAGNTKSFGAGWQDVYLIKTDDSGNQLWYQTFGGSEHDYGYSVNQTSDGGYIITGYTSTYGAGNNDVYLIKTDASGNEEWSRTFGGSQNDYGYCVQQTSDGGYIITGWTLSFGPDYYNVYLIKTDASGIELWSQTFGGDEQDKAYSVQQTSDGGYIIAGYTESSGAGDWDVFLIKTDASGAELWSQTFGGDDEDTGRSVKQTSDGGYIITGWTDSFAIGISSDVWLIKTDALGNQDWNQTFGGNSTDEGRSVQQTTDGGYIVAGRSISFGTGIEHDVYLIKTDDSGVEQWSQTIGDFSYNEYGHCVQQTVDGGYIIAGEKWSYAGGSTSVYLVRLESEGTSVESSALERETPGKFMLIGAHPNPFNPITTINFDLPVASLVKLDVFDINGRNVGAFRETPKRYTPGTHQITFNGTGLPSGIYIYRLTAGDFTGTGKMVLMK
ncbi:hypothetical protein CEE37_00630 [candidate division LCP-89 bacterium B3_LCP]|uniref:Secretion system C-terminal sorting domain-containing protein n=1 Tax=candidate division LCP-89 bacterium B3_LCP TaxID=2012998 RepID=A0A532V4U3_UNCL8|nr:MAG: hypothetical protein CEE37_00630 [candidate division LCP-89 bacterium B3_LCP]